MYKILNKMKFQRMIIRSCEILEQIQREAEGYEMSF